jgi:hypothetical protein
MREGLIDRRVPPRGEAVRDRAPLVDPSARRIMKAGAGHAAATTRSGRAGLVVLDDRTTTTIGDDDSQW